MSNRTICDNCKKAMPETMFGIAPKSWRHMSFSLLRHVASDVPQYDFCSDGCLVAFLENQLSETLRLAIVRDQDKASV